MIAATHLYAQTDTRLFNHLSVGLNVGTTGIGADIAMPATRFLDIEAGISIMPRIKYNTNLHLNLSTSAINPILPTPIDLDDIPVSVGAYFGSTEVAELYNTIDGQLLPISQAHTFIKDNNLPFDEIGLTVGDYQLTPDINGNVRATLKSNNFKPYVGLGFGRAVPKKRIGFKFDLGAMFWGSPEVIDHNGVSLTKQNWDGKDGGAFKTISKIKVYPVLNFRLCGRIF